MCAGECSGGSRKRNSKRKNGHEKVRTTRLKSNHERKTEAGIAAWHLREASGFKDLLDSLCRQLGQDTQRKGWFPWRGQHSIGKAENGDPARQKAAGNPAN